MVVIVDIKTREEYTRVEQCLITNGYTTLADDGAPNDVLMGVDLIIQDNVVTWGYSSDRPVLHWSTIIMSVDEACEYLHLHVDTLW